MRDYVAHSSRGRLRLRHPVLGAHGAEAKAILEARDDILEVRCGRASLLLLLRERADLPAIFSSLERAFPALARPAPERKLIGRKGENRMLLASGAACIACAICGGERAHAWLGAIFALFGARHVLERRKAL